MKPIALLRKKNVKFYDTNNCRKNGELFMVVGSPGGSTIITSVLQAILNVYEYNLSMQEAVNAPRFHHQWLPDLITFEPNAFSETTIERLKSKGYLINEKQRL